MTADGPDDKVRWQPRWKSRRNQDEHPDDVPDDKTSLKPDENPDENPNGNPDDRLVHLREMFSLSVVFCSGLMVGHMGCPFGCKLGYLPEVFSWVFIWPCHIGFHLAFLYGMASSISFWVVT
jgi:hypothetical protein